MTHPFVRVLAAIGAVTTIVLTLIILAYGFTTDIVPVLGGDIVQIYLSIASVISMVVGLVLLYMLRSAGFNRKTFPWLFIGLVGIVGGVALFIVVCNGNWQDWVN